MKLYAERERLTHGKQLEVTKNWSCSSLYCQHPGFEKQHDNFAPGLFEEGTTYCEGDLNNARKWSCLEHLGSKKSLFIYVKAQTPAYLFIQFLNHPVPLA